MDSKTIDDILAVTGIISLGVLLIPLMLNLDAADKMYNRRKEEVFSTYRSQMRFDLKEIKSRFYDEDSTPSEIQHIQLPGHFIGYMARKLFKPRNLSSIHQS